MGKIVTRNQPCPLPECSSSDGYQIYEDGGGKCFSCKGSGSKKFNETGTEVVPVERKRRSLISPYGQELTVEDIEKLETRGFKERKISKRVAEFYGCKIEYNAQGMIKAHYYRYTEKAYKVRTLPKTFYAIGVLDVLFGQEKFSQGGRRLVITEGELDAMAVQQANLDRWDKFYPVLSLRSSSSTKDLLKHRDWIRSFKEVVLMLDNDAAGEEATKEAITIIGYDKIKLAKLTFKDASEMYLNEGPESIQKAIFEAAAQTPVGMVSSKEAVLEVLRKHRALPSIPYPDCLRGLNLKLKGMRFNQISTFVSGTGSGKSTVSKEIMLHILETTPYKIGIVSLEESVAETASILSSMILRRNSAKYDLTIEELEEGVHQFFKEDEEGESRVVILDHQGAINNFSMYDRLEYMCLKGCQFLFIDHITILVSEGAEGKEGLEAQDKIMNDLLKLVKKYPVWIGLISHLRKVPSGQKSFEQGVIPTLDDIKGSGSIKQISFDVIGFARDMTADDESVRNLIKMASLKCRHTGLTGGVEGSMYDFDTGRLTAENDVDFEDLREALGNMVGDIIQTSPTSEQSALKQIEVDNDKEFKTIY